MTCVTLSWDRRSFFFWILIYDLVSLSNDAVGTPTLKLVPIPTPVPVFSSQLSRGCALRARDFKCSILACSLDSKTSSSKK